MGLTVIVKPTNECNLSCKYCYVDKKTKGEEMDPRTMALTLEASAKSSPDRRVHFIWHGGEPLLMGLDFYREVANVSGNLRSQGYLVQNSIQTNATLITENLLDFIQQQRDFQLGMSLDGPREINNRTRVYSDGSGTFDDIFRGVRMVNDRNLGRKPGEFYVGGGVIVVLNKQNINDLETVYEFFKGERINIKINPLMCCGNALKDPDALRITPQEYARAMNKLFDRWVTETPTIDIDPFSLVMGNLLTDRPIGCNYSQSCRKKFVSISPQGDVYPCGRFDGDKAFWMGNILDDKGLEKALQSPVQEKLSKRNSETVPGCNQCKYGKVCNAGCMHNALLGGDVMGKDIYCAGYKLMFPHVEKFIKRELTKAESKRTKREMISK